MVSPNIQKIHTGCNCRSCRMGKNKPRRKSYHKSLRIIHKKELLRDGFITNNTISLGYTD